MKLFKRVKARRDKVNATVATPGIRPIPTWWRHDCNVKHRNSRTLAKCMLGTNGTDEVYGEGPYAVLPCWKHCDYSVHLYPTELSARTAEREIDDTACGCRDHGHGYQGHRIVRLKPARK